MARKTPVAVVCAISLMTLLTGVAAVPLHIASFNLQNFGARKLGIQRVRDAIIQNKSFHLEYTIIVASTAAENKPSVEVQGPYACAGATFSSRVSNPLPALPGKRVRREVYAYIYRKSNVRMTEAHIYTNIVGNLGEPVFARAPAVVLVQPNPQIYKWAKYWIPYFLLIGLHAKPTRAYSELHGLGTTYNRAVNDFNQHANGRLNGNALILGDLNAACAYFGRTDQFQLTLTPAKGFKWLIGNNMPTNLRQNCAYDRFIALGNNMQFCAVNARVEVNSFRAIVGAVYGLNGPTTNKRLLARVSDHYPIAVDLSCSLPAHANK